MGLLGNLHGTISMISSIIFGLLFDTFWFKSESKSLLNVNAPKMIYFSNFALSAISSSCYSGYDPFLLPILATTTKSYVTSYHQECHKLKKNIRKLVY